MDMIEVKTADLNGPALRYAVALAEGYSIDQPSGAGHAYFVRRPEPGDRLPIVGLIRATGRKDCDYLPDEKWSHGGPLIDKHQPELIPCWGGDGWYARSRERPCDGDQMFGDTVLIAVCRSIAFAKFGDTVQVPRELV